MTHPYFATEAAAGAEAASPLAALGVDSKSFIFQLITFLFVFLLLKKFAFKPISKALIERRKTIDNGVRMGMSMEKEKAKLDEQVADITRQAREKADEIIANAHKEAREVIREAEKAAQRKTDAMLSDAEARITEEMSETIVGEKVDARKDAELVDRALKGKKK
jgi:F-type H+-transporting ATPase subunit b